MSEECVFCKIVSGAIPAAVIYEDQHFIGFLDINPRSKGHTLIIPKRHYTNLLELPEEESNKLGVVLRYLAERLVNILNATGFNILSNNGESAGQVVKHLHFHIIPRYGEKGHSLEVAFPIDEEAKKELNETVQRIGRIPSVIISNTETKQEEPKQKTKEDDKKEDADKEDYEGVIFDEVDSLPDM